MDDIMNVISLEELEYVINYHYDTLDESETHYQLRNGLIVNLEIGEGYVAVRMFYDFEHVYSNEYSWYEIMNLDFDRAQEIAETWDTDIKQYVDMLLSPIINYDAFDTEIYRDTYVVDNLLYIRAWNVYDDDNDDNVRLQRIKKAVSAMKLVVLHYNGVQV